jgi:hypothetical protein
MVTCFVRFGSFSTSEDGGASRDLRLRILEAFSCSKLEISTTVGLTVGVGSKSCAIKIWPSCCSSSGDSNENSSSIVDEVIEDNESRVLALLTEEVDCCVEWVRGGIGVTGDMENSPNPDAKNRTPSLIPSKTCVPEPVEDWDVGREWFATIRSNPLLTIRSHFFFN